MIITENLSKKFEDFTAVDSINLEVNPGELLALLGPNGAGKTTTVRMLTSVLHPSSGTAKVAGFDVVNQAPQVRASVGVLTEHHGLYNRMRASEYLEFFGEIYGLETKARKKRAKNMLNDFGLSNNANQRIGEFSKGMRQKLALGRALLHRPHVLLLDEPTSAMDPESARLVRDAIKELRSDQRSIMICTHNLAEAEELADRIAIIQDGKIIANDSPSALKMNMLGPPEYEVRLGEDLNGRQPNLPENVDLTANGKDWLRFRSDNPNDFNPLVVQKLVKQNFSIVSLQEVPRSLEQVYLRAVDSQYIKGDPVVS
ncbi:MAG: ABC transporter ATP-binding protein [Chloroflexi bacterium]|nr:ABC transporter ATP-binding protein [Chloroflexota bacterium]